MQHLSLPPHVRIRVPCRIAVGRCCTICQHDLAPITHVFATPHPHVRMWCQGAGHAGMCGVSMGATCMMQRLGCGQAIHTPLVPSAPTSYTCFALLGYMRINYDTRVLTSFCFVRVRFSFDLFQPHKLTFAL